MNRGTLPDLRRFPFPEIDVDFGINNIVGNRLPPWMEAVFGDETIDRLEEAVSELMTLVMDSRVLGSLTQAIGEAGDAVEEAVEAAENAVGGAVDAAEEFAEEVIEETEELVEEFIDKASNSASDVLNELAGWF